MPSVVDLRPVPDPVSGGTLPHMDSQHEREHAFADELASHQARSGVLPLKRSVAAFLDTLLGLLFPQLSDEGAASADEIQARLSLVRRDLRSLVRPLEDADRTEDVVREFTLAVPDLYHAIRLDGEAIVAGDPAAESLDEVVAAYPGFVAIATHRIAHDIHRLGVRVLPRLMSEVAHTRTGIDIHPGARIGRSFCIDHGTGVVIGETAVIGDDVKLYQGVTLGALSVAKSAAGTKRHPTLGDRVVIYSNATVLGGDTVVGDDSIIGGNVWLTHSVPPRSVVYHTSQIRVRSAAEAWEPSDFVI
jgi:serine O-acetyltransferase